MLTQKRRPGGSTLTRRQATPFSREMKSADLMGCTATLRELGAVSGLSQVGHPQDRPERC